MDIQMPVMDGIEVTHLIRDYEKKNPERKRTRIVALTANILGQDAEYCLSEGMDDYIGKPFKVEDIIRKMEAGKL
jgi:CheY-like chemotaxis protein